MNQSILYIFEYIIKQYSLCEASLRDFYLQNFEGDLSLCIQKFIVLKSGPFVGVALT